MQAYLFVHFREKTTPDGEQVYFGLSKDGFHWEAVNEGNPVLWAYYGDKGVRDFTIVRCKERRKFVGISRTGFAGRQRALQSLSDLVKSPEETCRQGVGLRGKGGGCSVCCIGLWRCLAHIFLEREGDLFLTGPPCRRRWQGRRQSEGWRIW